MLRGRRARPAHRGAQSPQGPQGPVGTALAYAQVNAGTPSFVAARTSGFSAVTRPAGGRYCLALDGALVGQAFSGGNPTRPTVASVEYGNTTNPGDPTLNVEVRGDSGDCPPNPPNTFEVLTFRNGVFTNDVSFTLIVP